MKLKDISSGVIKTINDKETVMIESKVIRLAELRRELKEAREMEKEAKRDMELTDFGQKWFGRVQKVEVLKDQIKAVDGEIREEALRIYDAWNDKNICEGVGVRIMRKVRYDLKIAETWCFKNVPGLLKLDTKKFEKFVRDNQDTIEVPVAEIYEEPVVTIAGDLEGEL